jgi:hypothetical protein
MPRYDLYKCLVDFVKCEIVLPWQNNPRGPFECSECERPCMSGGASDE